MPVDDKFVSHDPKDQFTIGCMAPYGGPAFPFVALGGYRHGENNNVSDESLYTRADSLILTFLINNKKNKDELGPALYWEQK